MPLSRKRKTLDPFGALSARFRMIDPTKGFVVGNVELIHKDIEPMMGDLSTAEFIPRCFKVVKNFTGKVLAGETIREDIREVVTTEVESLMQTIKSSQKR